MSSSLLYSAIAIAFSPDLLLEHINKDISTNIRTLQKLSMDLPSKTNENFARKNYSRLLLETIIVCRKIKPQSRLAWSCEDQGNIWAPLELGAHRPREFARKNCRTCRWEFCESSVSSSTHCVSVPLVITGIWWSPSGGGAFIPVGRRVLSVTYRRDELWNSCRP